MFEGQISKIRQKSETQRKKIVLAWSVFGTFLIALLWFLNLSLILPSANPQTAQTQVATSAPSGVVIVDKTAPSFWQTLPGALSDNIDSVAAGGKLAWAKLSSFFK